MCGILGGIETSFTEDSVRALTHRGPDQADFTVDQTDDGLTVALGQTRLSIVNRTDIDLPVRVGGAIIGFNGEIYNWRELQEKLTALGWCFATKTDTEVALVAYLEWGSDCLKRFNGMFALAIWDGTRYFCARDRLGEKPFFYRMRGRSFEFASEMKAFDRLEFVGHELFDLFEFCPDEHTLYRGISQLKPGHYLSYDPRSGSLSVESYWDIPDQIEPEITDPDDAVDAFIELMSDSVNLRMRADVPVTIFLSGGFDSTLIATLAGVDEAFTCQFDEFADTIDEERYARDFATRMGIRLNVVRPTREQFVDDLPELAYHMEMPTGSFSVFPLYRLAKGVHDAGYKVVLSGEGSDELFAGYARNEFLLKDGAKGRDGERAQTYSSLLSRFDGSGFDQFCRMASRSGLAGAVAMQEYLQPIWSERRSLLANMCYVETRLFLQPLLQMADRMSMSQSVEARTPFLDYRVVEFAFRLDDSIRFRDGRGKWIVREALKRLLGEDHLVVKRPIKHGLPAPINLWTQGHHSFDRGHWNATFTAACAESLTSDGIA